MVAPSLSFPPSLFCGTPNSHFWSPPLTSPGLLLPTASATPRGHRKENSKVGRGLCPEASAALGKMAAAVGNALPCGARPCGARPGGQHKPVPQRRTLLAAGPALIDNGDELVSAVWPYRRLALLRRLTVLPFAGLLYPAWLGASAAGCWGWGSSWAEIPEAALLALATICLAHALTVLSGHWSVHAHCALTCTPVSARAEPDLQCRLSRRASATAFQSSRIRPGHHVLGGPGSRAAPCTLERVHNFGPTTFLLCDPGTVYFLSLGFLPGVVTGFHKAIPVKSTAQGPTYVAV